MRYYSQTSWISKNTQYKVTKKLGLAPGLIHGKVCKIIYLIRQVYGLLVKLQIKYPQKNIGLIKNLLLSLLNQRLIEIIDQICRRDQELIFYSMPILLGISRDNINLGHEFWQSKILTK